MDLETVLLDGVIVSENDIKKESLNGSQIEDAVEMLVNALEDKIDFEAEPDFINGSEVDEDQRCRLLDWMIQVFRVLKKSTIETYFLTLRILDAFFVEKEKVDCLIKRD